MIRAGPYVRLSIILLRIAHNLGILELFYFIKLCISIPEVSRYNIESEATL